MPKLLYSAKIAAFKWIGNKKRIITKDTKKEKEEKKKLVRLNKGIS
jgi:hypothetical protein